MNKTKIMILALVIILAITFMSYYFVSQYDYGDSIPITEKFNQKESVEIVCLGDSLTYGMGSGTPYTSYLETDLKSLYGYENIDVINRGVNGRTSITLLKKYKDFISKDTDMVVLFIGANDIFQNKDVDTKKNIEKIVKWLLDRNIEVKICTYPYTQIERYFTEFEYEKITKYHSLIIELNNDIRDISNQYEIGLVDLEKNFYDLLDNGSYAYDDVFSDGVHFNKIGYKIMAEYIRKEL